MDPKDSDNNYAMSNGPRTLGTTQQQGPNPENIQYVSSGSSAFPITLPQNSDLFGSLTADPIQASYLAFPSMLGSGQFQNHVLEPWQRSQIGLDDAVIHYPAAIKVSAIGGEFSRSQTLAAPTWPTPSVSVLSSTGSDMWPSESDHATGFAKSTSGESNTTFTTSVPQTSASFEMPHNRHSANVFEHQYSDMYKDIEHKGWTHNSYSGSMVESATPQASRAAETEGSIHNGSQESSVRPEDDPNASVAGENDVIDIRDYIPSSPKSTTSSRPDYVAFDDGDDSHGRNSQLYTAVPDANGKYHCYFESRASCSHPPTKLKCNYDKYIDSHLKPYRCKVNACRHLRFSSTACRLRHEREAHGSHGHGVKPYPCLVPTCERAQEGNGFPRSWNRNDHMRRCHPTYVPEKEQTADQPTNAADLAVEVKMETTPKKNSKKRSAPTDSQPEKRRRTARTMSAPNLGTVTQPQTATVSNAQVQPAQETPQELLLLEWQKWHHSFQHHCQYLHSSEGDQSLAAIHALRYDLFIMERIDTALRSLSRQ